MPPAERKDPWQGVLYSGIGRCVYRTYPPVRLNLVNTNDIIIHPEVNEIISINLDSYKYKVDRFILRIEGVNYNEYGRVSSGVLFKVNGGSLPGNVIDGTYYILDYESNLVTTGKYKYVK